MKKRSTSYFRLKVRSFILLGDLQLTIYQTPKRTFISTISTATSIFISILRLQK